MERNSEQSAEQPAQLPAIHLQMVDNGDGTVRTDIRLNGADLLTALEMLSRAQASVILSIRQEHDKQQAEAEAARRRSPLIVPGRPLLRVN